MKTLIALVVVLVGFVAMGAELPPVDIMMMELPAPWDTTEYRASLAKNGQELPPWATWPDRITRLKETEYQLDFPSVVAEETVRDIAIRLREVVRREGGAVVKTSIRGETWCKWTITFACETSQWKPTRVNSILRQGTGYLVEFNGKPAEDISAITAFLGKDAKIQVKTK